MDLVDRLGSEAGNVDPRAWEHLRVYVPVAPKPEQKAEPVAQWNSAGAIWHMKQAEQEALHGAAMKKLTDMLRKAKQREPVAQGPVRIIGEVTFGFSSADSDTLECKSIVFDLEQATPGTHDIYTTPPDLAAEVERLKANEEKCDTAIISGAMRERDYLDRIAELERQQAVLVEALEEAREEVVGWAAYASEYFQQKHNLQGYVEKLDTTLASVKGNAELKGGA